MPSIIPVGLAELNLHSEPLRVWCPFFFHKVVKVECMDTKPVSDGLKDTLDFSEN